MAVENAGGPLPSPWNEFLIELDGTLNEPLELHCIGGFVLVHYYGLPRTTGDIDYHSAVPANLNLDRLLGKAHPFTRNTASGSIEWPSRIFPKNTNPGRQR